MLFRSTHDGDVPYTIILGAATSGDSDYDGFDATDVSVTNLAVNNQPALDPLDDLNLLEGAGATLVDRKSVVEGKSVSVRVDLGGGRYNIKTNQRVDITT